MLVESGGIQLLFDLGAGTMRRLLEAGRSIFNVEYVFFSHFHPDHTGELASFLFANKYPDESRRQKRLTLMGGSGFKAFFDGLKAVYGHWIDLGPDMLKIIELDLAVEKQVFFKNIQVQFEQMAHNQESLAYRVITAAGRVVVYSGDTDMNQNLVTISKNADVLICEAALPDELKAKGHLTPSLAGHIAAKAGVKRLVLTHLYPECDGVDIIAQCRKTYDGPLTLAADLMPIRV